MNQCGIIPFRREDILGWRTDGYMGECILNSRHNSPHLLKTPEGIHIAWEDDNDCDCCKGDDGDHCYTYWEITEKEAETLLKGQG